MRRGFPAVIILLAILFSSWLWAAKYHYSYIPRQVYSNQVFPVTLLASEVNSNQHINILYDPRSSVKPLFSEPLIQNNGGKSLFYTFYFKAGNEDFTLPNLYIDDGERKGVIKGVYIPVAQLEFPPDKKWCGVISSDFRVRTSQVSNFDEKNNLVYIVIEAHEANLEDMHIPDITEQGLEKFKRKFSETVAEYYFVVPAETEKITFRYFNSIKGQLEPVTISTTYRMKTTAAQEVDLNPKDSSFTKLKKYLLISLALFFLIMLIIKRDIFYLIIFSITIYALIKFFMPHDRVCVSEGAKLYILPISNSTVGTVIDKRKELPILYRYGDYYKIEYTPGLIGWIKESDVCKN